MFSGLPRRLLLGVAILHIVFFCIAVFSCIGFPYALDWIEGGMVDEVRMALSGKPLYVKPSLDFIPFMYPPLYMYVSAIAYKALGAGFLPLRVVSLAATAGTFSIVYLFVRRESGSFYYGLLACGLLAGSFVTTGFVFNMARVDQLYLFLFLAGVYLVRFHPSRKGYVGAAVLLSLSFLTKQTALVASLPLVLYAVVADGKKSLYLIIPAIVIAGGSILLLDHIHEGWYSFYVFKLPGGIPFEKRLIPVFLKQELMGPLSIACVTSLFFIASQLSSDRKKGLFYLMFAAGALGGSLLSRLNIQAALNVNGPAYTVISILFALGAYDALEKIKSSAHDITGMFEKFAILVFAIQLLALLYDPLKDLPTKKDMEAGADFVKVMSQFKGEIFVPFHGYVPVLAGKRTYAPDMAFYEIIRESDGAIKDGLVNEIRQALYERKFEAIILKPSIFDDGLMTQEDFKQNYDIKQVLFYEGTKYWPNEIDGPEFVCVRKQGKSGELEPPNN